MGPQRCGVSAYFIVRCGCHGNIPFLLGIRSVFRTDQYSIARVAPGVANNVQKDLLLICVQNFVTRWLRETGSEIKGQVELVGLLSVVAEEQIFIIVRTLPFEYRGKQGHSTGRCML